MRVKTCPTKIKATGDDTGSDNGLKEGEFEAIVSAFGNTDSVGDVVEKGAFTKSLEEWATSGNPIPVIWSHDHNNPDAHIGVVLESKEVDDGLWVKGAVDLDEPFAAKVYRLMKGRRVTKFSFAYDMKEYEENDQGGYNLKELDVWEVGPTLIPANDQTDLLTIKSRLERSGISVGEFLEFMEKSKGFDFKALAADLSKIAEASGSKAGRVLSAKNESALRDVHSGVMAQMEQLKSVLASVESTEEEDPENDPAKTATDEEPTDGKETEVSDDQKSATKTGLTSRSDAALRETLAIEMMLAEIE